VNCGTYATACTFGGPGTGVQSLGDCVGGGRTTYDPNQAMLDAFGAHP